MDRTIIEYQAEIARRAAAIIESGDLDRIRGYMSDQEVSRLGLNLATLMNCKSESSMERALQEFSELMTAAASRIAAAEYATEMRIAARANAIQRFYAKFGGAAA